MKILHVYKSNLFPNSDKKGDCKDSAKRALMCDAPFEEFFQKALKENAKAQNNSDEKEPER